MATAIFVSVILTIKYHKGTGIDLLDAQGICFTLYGMITFSRGISGACLNPAFGIIQTIFQNIVYFNRLGEKSEMTYKSLWIFALGPLMGGVLAGILSLALANMYSVSEDKKNQ